jgi:CRP-like cAMP-binding protein
MANPPLELTQLVQAPLFKDLSERILEEALHYASRRRVEADTYLFMQGDPADYIHLLLSGQMKLTQTTPEGQQIILAYAAPGDAIGVVAVLSGTDYPISAEAIETSQLLFWERDQMRRLMLRNPEIAINAIGVLAVRVREFQDRVRELSTERVERRIARALLRLANQAGRRVENGVLIDLPLSRQDLAQMTGTTLFTVSRTLKQWENQGLILSKREQVTIRFPHGLVTIAEDLPTSHRGRGAQEADDGR